MGSSVEPLQGANGEIVVMPNTGSPVSETSKATAAALERLEKTGSVLPADGVANPGTTTETPIREVPGAQPRSSDGKFGTPLPADAAKPAGDAAPAAGPDAEKPAAPAPEGEGTPEEIAAQEAAQERAVTIALEDGTEVELDLGDPALAATVRSQIEAARDAEAIRLDAEQQINEVLAIRESVQIDPVGFVLRQLADSPAGQDHLALSLITQPEVWERLRPLLEAAISDPAELRTLTAEQKAARAEYREQAQSELRTHEMVRENLGEIRRMCGAMATMIPNATREQQETVYNDMLRDLKEYSDRHRAVTINPDDVPLILARRLTAIGLDPTAAASRALQARAARPSKNGRSTRAATPITSRPAANAPAPTRQAPTGTQFVQAAERRKAVAIPAGGAGSPSVGSDLAPPANADGSPMTIAQTTAWHRAQLAKGKQGLVPAQ